MKEQRIEIKIDPQGRISADAAGYSGDACLKELERLLEDMPFAAGEIKRKPDESPARTTNIQTRKTGGRP